MIEQATRLAQEAQQAHERLYTLLKEICEISQRSADSKQLADSAYALKRAHQHAKDVTTQLGKAYDFVVRLACLQWTKDGVDEPIRTKHCTASPDVKMMASLPNQHRDPEKYAELLEAMGLPQELIKGDVVRPHWPSMVDWISDRLAAGLPMPSGIDTKAQYPVYKLTIRGKKEATEPAAAKNQRASEENDDDTF